MQKRKAYARYARKTGALALALSLAMLAFAGCNREEAPSSSLPDTASAIATDTTADIYDPTYTMTGEDTASTDQTGTTTENGAPVDPGKPGDTTKPATGTNKTQTPSKRPTSNQTQTQNPGVTTTTTQGGGNNRPSVIIPGGGGEDTQPTGETHTVKIDYWRGVNVSGAEFGSINGSAGEGSQFGWNSENTYKYFASKGFNLYRVPFLWGRMQPTLNGPLDSQYLAGLRRNVAWAKKYGGKVVLDLHNYGGYDNGQIRGQIDGDGSPVTTAHLIDLWVKLSNEFKNEDAIYAYGIMNEPHDMNGGNWYEISQAVVTAIRNNGDKHLLSIPNDNWTGAHSWPVDMEPWIDDPLDNIIYEAHQYFDNDSSGTYRRTYEQELAAHPNMEMIGVERMRGFVEWCNKYNVRGYMAEFSVPNNDSRWLKVLDNFMTYLDQNGIDATFWAAGERWAPEEQLSVQPGGNFNQDKIQMTVLEKHGPGTAYVEWAGEE